MEKIESTFTKYLAINHVETLRRLLNYSKFIFWLNVFHCLMPHVDILCNQLHKRTVNPIKVNMQLIHPKRKIQFPRISNEITNEVLTSKRRKPNDTHLSSDTTAKEIYDIIIVCVEDQLEYKNHLFASHLFITFNFPSYE